jgi:glycosyltransferase involved in cell wall biosynthesis
MSTLPLVSIITPTYHNRDERSFRRMLSSVTRQTTDAWEHIICSDGEAEVMPRTAVIDAADSRQRYIVSGRHYGGWGAGVRDEVMRYYAKGQYLVFLDDDNIIFTDYLERMVAALRAAPEARFAICMIFHCGRINVDVGVAPLYMRGEPKVYLIDTLQVMVEAAAMLQVGWVEPQDYRSDGFTYERLGKTFPYTRVEQCLGVHL